MAIKLIWLIALLIQLSATSMAKSEKTKPSPSFEEAWPTLEEAFNKITSISDGSSSYIFTSEDYMNYYAYVSFYFNIIYRFTVTAQQAQHISLSLMRFNLCDTLYDTLTRTVYEACSPRKGDVDQKFYNAYKKSFEDYISSKVRLGIICFLDIFDLI